MKLKRAFGIVETARDLWVVRFRRWFSYPYLTKAVGGKTWLESGRFFCGLFDQSRAFLEIRC